MVMSPKAQGQKKNESIGIKASTRATCCGANKQALMSPKAQGLVSNTHHGQELHVEVLHTWHYERWERGEEDDLWLRGQEDDVFG